MERRLTAILAADVVGYSRLMGDDEAGTLTALKTLRRELVKPKEIQYRGRTVKLMGDGALMEFASVVDAVAFAVEVQAAMAERNQEVPEDRRIVYRMGINIGDIIVEGDDIYGDGVNIAARLEGLADPGGICISRSVHTQIAGKLDLEFEDLGEQQVKNIAKPVMVYRVALDERAAALVTPITVTPPTTGRGRGSQIAAGLVFSLVVVAGLVWWQPWVPDVEPASVERMAFPLPDKPSIAVLPFNNMSDDPSQEYFADGMTEDVITDLSKISGLFVIARNTTFTYKGQTVAPRKVAEDLGVRYILEGSVRRAGDQVRINAQLIDATTGGHLWAERYDGGLSDVFALQDRVTGNIVEALAISLKPDEIAKSGRAETSNQEAYDAFLRGWAYYRQYTPRDVTRAIPHFERAIAVDPDYSRAYAALASIYWIASGERYSLGTGVWLTALGLRYQEARNLNDEYLAQALRRPTPLAHQVASGMRLREGRFDDALTEARKAIQLDPNDPIGHEALAEALIYGGDPVEGEKAIRTAMRLDPLFLGEYLTWLGLAEIGQERHAAAAKTLRDAVSKNPDNDVALVLLISALGHQGRLDEAGAYLNRLNQFRASYQAELTESAQDRIVGVDTLLIGPLTLSDTNYWLFKNSSDRHRFREGLRLAGVPEAGEADVSPRTVPGASTLDATQAKALHDEGVAFVDTRALGLWDLGRIPGAALLDLTSDFTEEKLADVVGRNDPVVIYCEGPKCLRSSQACAKAVEWGFTNVYYFRNGFPSWKAEGYPVELDE